jgi:hypothetical protein
MRRGVWMAFLCCCRSPLLKRIIFAKADREGTGDARDQRLGRRRRTGQPDNSEKFPGCTTAKKIRPESQKANGSIRNCRAYLVQTQRRRPFRVRTAMREFIR